MKLIQIKARTQKGSNDADTKITALRQRLTEAEQALNTQMEDAQKDLDAKREDM